MPLQPRLPSRHILVVDDDAANRDLLSGHLDLLGYTTIAVADGSAAIDALSPDIAAVILDVMLPKMDGFAVTRAIRSHPLYSEVPIILCTALDGRGDRLDGVEAGANDFITKPVNHTELRVRLASQIRMKDAQDAVRNYQSQLETTVAARTKELCVALEELNDSNKDTVRRLALAAEYRDGGTAAHLERVGQYCALIGRARGLSAEETDLLYHASTMHDVGKIGISDSILLKPGPLSEEDRRVMQEHTRIGAALLTGSASPLLRAGELIALSHHEHWDGSGYPRGLSGTDIPLFGRICAIADVFDALTSARPYKPAYSTEETRCILLQGRGSQFDPDLLDLFLDYFAEVTHIWLESQDR